MSYPFEDKYRLRKVAETDWKPCFICYKPTSAVLITANQVDFFYVCLAHLKDARGFCTPVYGPEVEETKRELKTKKERAQIVQFLIDQKTKSGTWSKIMNMGSKTDEKVAESANKEKEKKKQTVEELRLEVAELNKETKALEEKVEALEKSVKEYVLNKDIYRIRLGNYSKKLVQKKRVEQVSSGEFFPTIPTGSLTKEN